MQKSNKNIITVIIIAFFAILIPVFNYFVDPYGLFSDKEVYKTWDNERDTIYQKIKKEKDERYDYVMIGDSGTAECFEEEDFEKITGKTLKKLKLNGMTIQEQYKLLQVYTDNHPENKSVILTLNFLAFIEKPLDKLPPLESTQTITSEELFKVLFSLDATLDSLYSFKLECINFHTKNLFLKFRDSKIAQSIPFIRDYKLKIEKRVIYPNLRKPFKKTASVNRSHIIFLKKIVYYCKKKNLNVFFIVNPSHTYEVCNIYKSGIWNTYSNFKKEIAEITPFYDLWYINPYNVAPIDFNNNYWNDVLHPTRELGFVFLSEIFRNKEESASMINKKNVQNVIKQQKNGIKTFIAEHQTEIDNYMKKETEDYTPKILYSYW